ncbi:CbtB domain-containing protein [Entomobacter blattae]|uniref:Putative cobalt transporter subunit (CbtB) n=1 Tax=Entomobacter blattae TaxID=2762277 RepID=A0A7H1NPK8_9PROT|nr:CbtB domain-containing protein [Entomobacter blattae]QNT77718.1 putative cobalt transporter subunit (CbtB) [Entomobacter blattae]
MFQSSAVSRQDILPTIPLRQVMPWALFSLVLFTVLLYFVGAEQGATAVVSGHYIHEFVHDGRHILGFPCH